MKQPKQSRFLSLSAPIALTLAALFVGCSPSDGETSGDGDGDGDGDSVGSGGTVVGDGDGDTGGMTGDGDTGGMTGDGDTGGMTGDGDTGGQGGAMGTGGDSGTIGTPVCVGVSKGDPCTGDAMCWKACGPSNVGWKSETCVADAYVEGECEFPDTEDYSCYAIPVTQDASCPVEAPQHNTACSVEACNVCSASGMYKDSGGATKAGYCTCVESQWKCASTSAWPCPGASGCGD